MADNFGLRIGVEGEKDFKNALRDINQNFKVLGSEMKLNTAQFDRQDQSIEALTARNGALAKSVDAQKDKISTLEAALRNAADAFGENDRRMQNWQIQLNNAKSELMKMERELENNNQAIQDLNEGFNDAEGEVEEFANEVQNAADQTEDASGRFEKLGGVLVAGAESGAFSIDKVGDAVKEFNIRAKDGSKSSMEAFAALGLNAEEMTNKFAQGGETANAAFFSVIQKLQEIEDPLLKNTIGVQLFGTQFEDLEASILPILGGIKDSTIASGDALAQITEVKYDNLTDGIEGVKRSLQGVFLPAVSEVSAGITDLFSGLSNGINEADGDFEYLLPKIDIVTICAVRLLD